MMTYREARQRLELSHMRIDRVQDSDPQEYRISFMEATHRDEKSAYYTDDLEDAALTGAAMRIKKGK